MALKLCIVLTKNLGGNYSEFCIASRLGIQNVSVIPDENELLIQY